MCYGVDLMKVGDVEARSWKSRCRMRMSVAPLSDVNVTVGEKMEKTLCSGTGDCVAKVLDTL